MGMEHVRAYGILRFVSMETVFAVEGLIASPDPVAGFPGLTPTRIPLEQTAQS